MSETVNNVNVENQKKEEKTGTAIVVIPQEFKTHTEGLITNTSNLTDLINQLFASVFNDYVGCRLYVHDNTQPLPNELMFSMCMGNLYADLYFEKSQVKSDGIDNLELISKSGTSTVERLSRVCGGGVSRVYNLNKDTKEALMEFIPGYNPNIKNFNPMWGSRTVEEATNTTSFNNQMKSVLRVMAMDVDAIIGKIYGTHAMAEVEDPNTHEVTLQPVGPLKYDYHCLTIMRSNKGMMSYMNPGFNNGAMIAKEFVVQILRNDRSIIAAMQEAVGVAPMFTGSYVPYNRT